MIRILKAIGDGVKTVTQLHTIAKLRLASLATSVFLTLVVSSYFGLIIGWAWQVGLGFELSKESTMAFVIVSVIGVVSWASFACFMAMPIRKRMNTR